MADSLLSAKERVQIRTYNSVGLTNEEIAEKVGVTIRDVEIEIQRQGLKEHVRDIPQPHAFVKPKAPEHFAEEPKENKPKRQAPGLWSGESGERLKALFLEGKSVSEIAEILGLTSKQVSQGIYNQKKKWGNISDLTEKPEPKKKAATVNPEFEEAVKPMFDSVKKPVEAAKKYKVPQTIIEMARDQLNLYEIQYKQIKNTYEDLISKIEDLEEFIKECE